MQLNLALINPQLRILSVDEFNQAVNGFGAL